MVRSPLSPFVVAATAMLALLASLSPLSIHAQSAEIEVPKIVLTNVPFDIKVTATGLEDGVSLITLAMEGGASQQVVSDGVATFKGITLSSTDESMIRVLYDGTELTSAEPMMLPGWASILPAFIAILLALLLRQVIPAIFSGVWIGAWLVNGFTLSGMWFGLLDSVQVYVISALSDSGNLSVLVFSLMIGGMIGIISRNGGTVGIVNGIIGFANSARRGQVTTGLLGVAIFFDDYANTLIVGNTMRPVTDRLRISREKLAYIVDSTAAPVSAVALVTTWIGYEVGLIDAAVRSIDGYDEAAYSVFLSSIPYSFYPILAILFVFAVAIFGRDFGPMYRAERRARVEGLVLRPGAEIGQSNAESEAIAAKDGQPQRAVNAVVPVLVLVAATLIGIYVTGAAGSEPDAGLRTIIGNGDSYRALVWASLLGVFAASILSIGQRILTLGEVVESWYSGMKSMMFAIIILILAWSLAGVNTVLNTGGYLVTVLGGELSPSLLPAVIFALSAVTAFATGSSWGVMGIVMPLAVPLSWAVMELNGLTADTGSMHILYSTVSAVLAGAVWGDHCSPISDTTILSSMASGCDHVDHVRTQLPYAVTVGVVAMLIGTVPAGYGLPWWVGMLIGLAILIGILFGVGRDAGKDAGKELAKA